MLILLLLNTYAKCPATGHLVNTYDFFSIVVIEDDNSNNTKGNKRE
jgi:hypothetical protein